MKKFMEDKRTMFAAVESLLTVNIGKLGLVPGFAEAINGFKDLLARIDSKAKEKDDVTAGKTETKHTAEGSLIKAMMKGGSALFLYARKMNDAELRDKSNLLESTLTRMRDTDLATKAEGILELMKHYTAQIGTYGVNAEEVTDLETKIAVYRDALGRSASSIPERKGARISLENLMKDADTYLTEEIDRYMERIRDKEPELYNSYCDATYIRITGVRHEPEAKQEPTVATAGTVK